MGAALSAVVAATGFTSTVLLAAVLRRRGVEDGVAIAGKSWMQNGGGGAEGRSLSVRRPVIDDPTDCEIGEHRVVWTGMASSRSASSEHPIALSGADWINSNKLLALVVHKDAQVHVIQTRDAEGTNQRVRHLHDLHQAAEPPDDLEEGEELGEGDADLGGSGSQ